MKLLTLSAAALAHPAAEQGTDLILFDEEGVKSMGMHVEHRAALEVHDEYSTVATVIETIGTIREELCLITFGYYTGRFVCNNMGWNDCDAVAGAVAAASLRHHADCSARVWSQSRATGKLVRGKVVVKYLHNKVLEDKRYQKNVFVSNRTISG